MARNDAEREKENLRAESAQVKAVETLTEEGGGQEDKVDAELDFVYNMIALDLNIKGYEVFDAVVKKQTAMKSRASAIPITRISRREKKIEYYQAGFIRNLDEAPPSPDDIVAGVKVEERIEEDD